MVAVHTTDSLSLSHYAKKQVQLNKDLVFNILIDVVVVVVVFCVV